MLAGGLAVVQAVFRSLRWLGGGASCVPVPAVAWRLCKLLSGPCGGSPMTPRCCKLRSRGALARALRALAGRFPFRRDAPSCFLVLSRPPVRDNRRSWSLLDRSWSVLERLVASWSGLGALLERLGAVLERSWSALGALLARLGELLERSWSALGASWSVMQRSWSLLERSWRVLERS